MAPESNNHVHVIQVGIFLSVFQSCRTPEIFSSTNDGPSPDYQLLKREREAVLSRGVGIWGVTSPSLSYDNHFG